MRKIILSFYLFFVLISTAQAQCPVAGFSLPDSICGGNSFQISNTSTAGMDYYWDLCPGDLKNIPQGLNYGPDGNLSFPQQVRLIKDNGKYFLFLVNFFGNNLLRYDFGTSLDNTPVLFIYASLGFNQPHGLDIYNENGTWYALVANYANARLTRVDLGVLIENNIATSTDLGQFGFNGPRGVEIVYDGSDFFVFVTNDSGSDIIRIDFGNSLTNNPVTFTALTNALFNFTWGFDVKYDCALNKWIGYVAAYNLSQVHVLDFGNSLSNPVTINSTINTLPNPSGLELIRDGNEWHAVIICVGALKVQNFSISNNLFAAPVQVFADTLGEMANPRFITLFEDSSRVTGFISNGAGTLAKVVWPSPCNATPESADSTNSVTASINAAGYYPIALEVKDPSGYTSYYTDSIYLNAAPVIDFVFTTGCEGIPVSFSDSSTIPSGAISSWSWDFGDASPPDNNQNPVHTFPGTGTYTVTLTATSQSGCIASDSIDVTINPIPDADFSFPNNQCSQTAVSFTDLSQAFGGNSIQSWTWDFGDGSPVSNDQNPIHIFDSSGVYNILLVIVTDVGCSDSITQQITIKAMPVAGFTVSQTCVGEIAIFTNSSTVQGGGAMTFDWDFGDSNTSSLQDPTHPYAASAANYDVQLISTYNGCADTIIQNIRISNKPVPDFTWAPQVVCQGNTVTFSNNSAGTGGDTISLYVWDFGDSTVSVLENPTHAYADTGYYQVTLTAVSPTNCDSSITQQLYVIPSPTATFTAGNVCLNNNTPFFPSVTTPPGTVVDSIVWDFGDSTTFTGLTSPVHLYASPGTYYVTMTVYNDLLCTGTFSDSIDVYPLPVADFSTGIACSGSPVQFDGTVSTVLNDVITSWLWDFDGLGTSTDSIATFAFSNSGTYDVTLIVSTQHSCTDTVSLPVNIIASPDFTYTFNEPCDGNPVTFNFISNTIPPPPSNLTWSFGDGNQSSLLNPTHLYSTADTFSVSLFVLNPNTGCTSQLDTQLVIKPVPLAGFTALDICQGLPLQFNDTSSVATGTISSWNWNFNNLGTDSVQNPVFVFTDPGIYNVTLDIISDQGCSSSANSNVIILPNPDASFTPNPVYGSPPLTVNFVNQTTGGLNYVWNFGDGSGPGSGFSPTHIYQDTGNYNITMIAISADGCNDTANSIVSVLIPFIDISVDKIYSTRTNDLFRLSADITNQGNVIVNTFQIRGSIEDGSIIKEQWSGIMEPGASLTYLFVARYELDPDQVPGFFCIETLSPNNGTDQKPENNKKCAVTDESFELYSAFPNPFNESLNLSLNLPLEGFYDIEIYDSAGKLVHRSKDVKGIKGYNSIKISTLTFGKGIYACSVKFRDDIRILRVMKIID
jgi:PKD repeat protein